MVDSPVVCPALVLLAVVSGRWCLCWSCDGRRRTADAGRTEYLQGPTMGRPAGSASRSRPAMKTIIPYRYWLIEGQVSGNRLRHCAGPPHEPAHGQDRADAFYPAGFFDLAFEDVNSSTTLTVSP